MNKIEKVVVNSNEGYEILGDDGSMILTGLASYNFKVKYRNDNEVQFECVTDSLPACKRGSIITIDKCDNRKEDYK